MSNQQDDIPDDPQVSQPDHQVEFAKSAVISATEEAIIQGQPLKWIRSIKQGRFFLVRPDAITKAGFAGFSICADCLIATGGVLYELGYRKHEINPVLEQVKLLTFEQWQTAPMDLSICSMDGKAFLVKDGIEFLTQSREIIDAFISGRLKAHRLQLPAIATIVLEKRLSEFNKRPHVVKSIVDYFLKLEAKKVQEQSEGFAKAMLKYGYKPEVILEVLTSEK